MLPYLLFEDDPGARRKAVLVCCLGWNISLFPDVAQREAHIDRVWKMIEADNQKPSPPGFAQGFKKELGILVSKKNDLFPWQSESVPNAELSRKGTRDVLTIETSEGVKKIQVVTHPDPMGLPRIIDVLREIQEDTENQVSVMERAMRTERVLNDKQKTQMATLYCVQRADLIGFHRMLTVWRETQPAPSVKRVIGYWLEVLNEIEENTKKVLTLLVNCK